MGWLWSSSASNEHAKHNLDPAVRRILQQESPSAQAAASPRGRNGSLDQSRDDALPTQQRQAPDYYRTKVGFLESPEANVPSKQIPAESLFHDGRYAHLWASYRPPEEVEAGSANHDKLGSVVETHREHQAQISRAALENCVFFQLAERECLDRGSFKDRLTMCSAQTRASNRCYTMQSRFLRALGYASTGTTIGDNDRIQLHSEELYNEMLERATKIDEAKKEGLPEPRFAPLLKQQQPTERPTASKSEALALFGPEKLRQLEATMADLSQAEKDLELQLLMADAKAHMKFNRDVGRFFENEKAERAARKDRGQETFGDTLKRLWGWNT